tara:strand:- start:1444 stop:1596 length:153 start_codon:yes stop_codon:yes gene_type:complete
MASKEKDSGSAEAVVEDETVGSIHGEGGHFSTHPLDTAAKVHTTDAHFYN